MKPVATHYGWPVSPYSAKTRSYLRYKGIAFSDCTPAFWTLQGKVKRGVGKVIMPSVQLASGEWLQDSSAIVDEFERRLNDSSVKPCLC